MSVSVSVRVRVERFFVGRVGIHLFPSGGVRFRFSIADDLKVYPLEKAKSSLPDEKIRESAKRRAKFTAFALRASADLNGAGQAAPGKR